jgi:hypothetical protein
MAHAPLTPDLVTALLGSRDDSATAAFDEALRSAEASGRIAAITARELQYWQRRSLDAVVDHAAEVIPASLEARHRSDVAAREATAEARMSWQQARALMSAADDIGTTNEDPTESTGAPPRRVGTTGLSVVSDED